MTTATQDLKSMTIQEQNDYWDEVMIRCKNSIFEFLKYIKVKEPGVGAIPFELYPHLLDTMRLIYNNKYSIILKARQVGASHLMAAISLHEAMFKPASLILMTSQNEEKAISLLAKVKYMHQQLPYAIRLREGTGGQLKLTFPGNESQIMALPSTENAAIGEHASMLIMDEADMHPYATEYFNMAKPTIDKGNAKLVMLSTIKPDDQSTLFKSIYRATMRGRGQFKRMFISWNVMPGRDERWLHKVCDNEYADAKMTKELYKASQYPDNENEAMSPPSAIAAFNHQNLLKMKADCDAVIPVERDGPITYWRRFDPTHTYTAFTDTSDGTGADKSATVVFDMHSGMVVADIVSQVLGPEEMVFHAVKMLEKYRFPLWGIENNNRGINAVNAALSHKYPNLFYQDWQKEYKRDDMKKTKPGWNTGPSEGNNRHRVILFNEGINAVDRGDIRILNEEALQDFFSVVRNPNNKGRIEGLKGTNDDYPFAVCGAWQMTKFTRKTSTGPVAPVSIMG